MYQRILVTTDGSKLSQKAIATAIKLAGLTGAELVALKVVQRYPQSYFEGGMALVGEDVKQVEKTWGDAAQKVVNAVKKTAEDAGIKTKAVVVRYLAFVPGEGQGLGRGEAYDFLHDLVAGLELRHRRPRLDDDAGQVPSRDHREERR